MRRAAVGIVVLLAIPRAVSAGDPPAWVDEALAWGATQKRVEPSFAAGSHLLRYSTPFQRVAAAANEARRQGQTLDRSSVPGELMASALHVFVGMQAMHGAGRLTGMTPASDVSLTVSGQRLTPSRVERIPIPMRAGEMGGEMQQFEGLELRAVFPMEPPIPRDATAVVEYTWVEGGVEKRTERSFKLNLGKGRW